MAVKIDCSMLVVPWRKYVIIIAVPPSIYTMGMLTLVGSLPISKKQIPRIVHLRSKYNAFNIILKCDTTTAALSMLI